MTGADTPDDEKDKASRFIVLEGAGGRPLSPLLQSAARERGWLVNDAGHALMPKLYDPVYAWRRFCAFLGLVAKQGMPEGGDDLSALLRRAELSARDEQARAQLEEFERIRRETNAILRQRSRTLTDSERALVDAYMVDIGPTQAPPRKKITRKPSPPGARKPMGPKPDEEKWAKAREAAALCIEAGFNVSEACERSGAHARMVHRILQDKRDAGEDMGLYEFGKSRVMSLTRKGKKYKKQTGDDQ